MPRKNDYTPRPGSNGANAVAALLDGPMLPAALAAALGLEAKQLQSRLQTTLNHGAIVRVQNDAGEAHYALPGFPLPEGFCQGKKKRKATSRGKDAPPQAETAPAPGFACAAWSDGELSMARDGEGLATLSAAEVAVLRAFFDLHPNLGTGVAA